MTSKTVIPDPNAFPDPNDCTFETRRHRELQAEVAALDAILKTFIASILAGGGDVALAREAATAIKGRAVAALEEADFTVSGDRDAVAVALEEQFRSNATAAARKFFATLHFGP